MLERNEIALYLSGQPVLIKECSLLLTQPTIKQIVVFGENEFLQGAQIIGHYKAYVKIVRKANEQDGVNEIESYSDFQIFMIILHQEPIIRESVKLFFQLICPEYDVTFSEHMIGFSVKEDENHATVATINPFTLDRFAEVVKNLFLMKGEKDIEYNPSNDRAKAIRDKILEGRRRTAAQKQLEDGKNTSLFGSYISILSIGLSMDINTIYNYTPFQLYDSVKRFYAKTSSDFYQRVSTMPLLDTSKMEAPEDWGRNFYK